MFGQAPRSESDFWKLVYDNGIEDEESLPTPIAELNDDLIDDKDDNRITSDDSIDSEVIDLVSQLSADACSHSLISTPSRHSAIRTVATDHYL
ncbi:unnamed protein product, partial [Rotaria magnacalcarata]